MARVNVEGKLFVDLQWAGSIKKFTLVLAAVAMILTVAGPAAASVDDAFYGSSPSYTTKAPKPKDTGTGKHNVDLKTGAVSYSVPIVVPPGRLGIEPRISLDYSSSNPLTGTSLGAGWNLGGLPSIHYVPASSTEDEAHYEIRGGGGSRLMYTPQISSRYSFGWDYRADFDGGFASLTATYGNWIMHTKDGRIHRFSSFDAIGYHYSSGNKSWVLSSTEDAYGNKVTYHWSKPTFSAGGINVVQSQLDRIEYTHGTGQTAHAKVFFTYADDNCNGRPVGAKLNTFYTPTYSGARRLTNIETQALNADGSSYRSVREYDFSYQNIANSCASPHRLLTGIIPSIFDSKAPHGQRILPIIEFSYSNATRDLNTQHLMTDAGSPTAYKPKRGGVDGTESDLKDIDGDGIDDLISVDVNPVNTKCRLVWRKGQAGGGYAPTARYADLPTLHWFSTAGPNVGTSGEFCNLTGQQTQFNSLSGSDSPCTQKGAPAWLAYQFSDLGGDKAADLVAQVWVSEGTNWAMQGTTRPSGGTSSLDCLEIPVRESTGEWPIYTNSSSGGDVTFFGPSSFEAFASAAVPPTLNSEELPANPGGIPRVVDIDGDGFLDNVLPPTSGTGNWIWHRGGVGNTYNTYFAGPVTWPGGIVIMPTTNATLADLNGDGRPDLVVGNGSDIEVRWNNGSGFEPPVSLGLGSGYAEVLYRTESGGVADRWIEKGFLDINSDGLADRVNFSNSTVQYNLGGSFGTAVSLPGQAWRTRNWYSAANNTWHAYMTMKDMDADGLPDAVVFDSNQTTYYTDSNPMPPSRLIYISNGRGAEMEFAYGHTSNPSLFDDQGIREQSRRWVVNQVKTRAASGDSWLTVDYTYEGTTHGRADGYGGRPGFLGFNEVTAHYPNGKTIESEYTYAPANYYAIREDRRGFLKRVTTCSGPCTTGTKLSESTTEWATLPWGHTQIYPADSDLRITLPWRRVTYTCDASGQCNDLLRTSTLYEEIVDSSGVTLMWAPYRVYRGSSLATSVDDKVRVMSNELRDRRVSGPRFHHVVAQVEDGLQAWVPGAPQTMLFPDGTPQNLYDLWTSKRTARHIDGYGGVLAEVNWFDGTTESATAYQRDSNGNVSKVVSPKHVKAWRDAGGSGTLTNPSYTIYGASTAEPWDKPGTNVFTDAIAGVVNQRSFAYQSGVYVSADKNELDQTTTYLTDMGTGELLEKEEPSSKAVTDDCSYQVCGWWGCYTVTQYCTVYVHPKVVFSLDGAGRVLTKEESVDDHLYAYSLELVQENTYNDFSGIVTQRIHWDYTGSNYAETETHLDGYGRPILVKEPLDAGGTADTSYDYDSYGRLVEVVSPSPEVDGATVSYTWGFDVFDRPAWFRRPDATGFDIGYDGLEVTATQVSSDTSNPAKSITRDVYGRLTTIVEDVGGLSATTQYQYDANDQLQQVTDADANITNIEHDWAGNRSKITRGTRDWSYAYDGNGNLTSKVIPYASGHSAPAYTTTYSYDALDRITQDSPPSSNVDLGIGPIDYSYDQNENGVSHLSRVDLPWGYVEYGYDARGMVTFEQRQVESNYLVRMNKKTQEVVRSFGPQGELLNEVWDDDQEVKWAYNKRGQVTSVDWREDSSSSWQNLGTYTRFKAGNVKARSVSLGAAGTFDRDYTYDELGRVVTDTATSDTGTVIEQHFTHIYDFFGSGNLRTIDGNTMGTQLSWTYEYDPLHRITRAWDGQGLGTLPYDSDFTYSKGGNVLTAKVNLAPARLGTRDVTYAYGAVDPQAVDTLSHAGGGTDDFTYDMAGNLVVRDTASGILNLTWDKEEVLREVDGPNGKEAYYYDHRGQRVLSQTDSDDTLKFWFGPRETHYEKLPGQSKASEVNRLLYISDGGSTIARTEDDGIATSFELHLADPLQNLVLTVDMSNLVTSHFIYSPFGEILEASGEAEHRRQFNGKENDSISGLRYYGARYYDPILLRWISGDPLLRFAPEADFTNPQQQNIYQFSLNNPLRFHDPDGRIGTGAENHENAVQDAIVLTAETNPELLVASGTIAFVGAAVLTFGVQATAAYIGKEAAEFVVEELTGIPIINGPEDLAEFAVKRGAKSKAKREGGETMTEIFNDAARGGGGGKPRVNKVGPHKDAQGPHTTFKTDQKDKVSGYTTYDGNGNPVKRFRGEGKRHGGVEPPLVLEPKPGKGPGSPPKMPRKPKPDELPNGYGVQ